MGGHRRGSDFGDPARVSRLTVQPTAALTALILERRPHPEQGFRACLGILRLARDGRFARLMRALGGVKLLILDDWGLEPLGPEQRRDLLEIVEERYGRGATLITSQIPASFRGTRARWTPFIKGPRAG